MITGAFVLDKCSFQPGYLQDEMYVFKFQECVNLLVRFEVKSLDLM